MKKSLSFLALAAAMLFCITSCTEKITPDDPDEKVPEAGFGFYVNEDGSVIVEGDNGIDRINSLATAIKTYADSTVTATESGNSVKCSNEFILPRGSYYYMDTKFNCPSAVKVRASEGKGELPTIKRLYDASGKAPGNIMYPENDIEFDNVHFDLREATDDNWAETVGLRINAAGITVTLKGCLCEYAEKSFIRCDTKDNTIRMTDCIVRNMGNASRVNEGRVVDTRGKAQKEISLDNCYIYNVQSQIIRDGETAVIQNVNITNCTLYNNGDRPSFAYPRNLVIKDNIIANMGFKTGAQAALPNAVFGKVVTAFWSFEYVTEAGIADVNSIVLDNNNVFYYDEMKSLSAKYPDSAILSGLSDMGEALKAAGKLTNNNQISEVLTFDNPAPIGYDFIEVFYANPTADVPEQYAGKQFYTDLSHTFNYPVSAKSATASSTGGKLGANL